MKKLIALVLFLSASTISSTLARPNREEAKKACGEDRESFCQGLEKRELMTCFKENKDQLSSSCQAFISEHKAPKSK